MVAPTSSLRDDNDNSSISPSFSLKILFGLNGSTLALPYIAMMYIVNDRVHVPVELLSAYGAISFLPWSLKPFYASVDTHLWKRGRHELLSLLLVLSSIMMESMILVPPDGVLWCFLVVFVQNIATSFAEFLLGLTLIDEIISRVENTPTSIRKPAENSNQQDGFKDFQNNITCSPRGPTPTSEIQLESVLLPMTSPVIAEVETIHETTNNQQNTNSNTSSSTKESLFQNLSGIYQGQAATARNVGSLLASLLLLPILIMRNQGKTQKISFTFCILLLSLTSAMPLIGAAIVWKYKVGTKSYQQSSPLSSEEEKSQEVISFLSNIRTSFAIDDDYTMGEECVLVPGEESFPMLSNSEKATIVTLQLLVVWMGLKSVISHPSLWITIFIILLMSFLYCAIASTWDFGTETPCSTSTYTKAAATTLLQRNVALYLILVQIMPSASYQWYSYTYYLFGSEPMIIPLLSLVESIATTLGSNVYAQYVAPKVTTRDTFIRWTGIATIMYTVTSLLYLLVTVRNSENPESSVWTNFILILPISAITSFCSEIRFLPSVALATSTIQFSTNIFPNAAPHDGSTPLSPSCSSSSVLDTSSHQTTIRNASTKIGNAGLQYGSYISCIDFGDQLGAWTTVPIVAALGITRGDWSNMTELILICAFGSLLSLTFLALLLPSQANTIKRRSMSMIPLSS